MDTVTHNFSETLYCAWPTGELNQEKIRFIIHSIAVHERSGRHPFNRFIDLSAVEAITVTEASMAPVTQMRKSEIVREPDVAVKIALLATTQINYSLARIYERLMASQGVMVMVFRYLEDAAHWLEVTPSSLMRPA